MFTVVDIITRSVGKLVVIIAFSLFINGKFTFLKLATE